MGVGLKMRNWVIMEGYRIEIEKCVKEVSFDDDERYVWVLEK